MTPGTGTDPFFRHRTWRNSDRTSVASDMADYYFSQRRGSTMTRSPGAAPQDYGHFLDRANRQITRDKKHVPDPFLEPGMAAANRQFGPYSRVSSVESISSIADKQNSPLNKAIASVGLILPARHLLLITSSSSRTRAVVSLLTSSC